MTVERELAEVAIADTIEGSLNAAPELQRFLVCCVHPMMVAPCGAACLKQPSSLRSVRS